MCLACAERRLVQFSTAVQVPSSQFEFKFAGSISMCFISFAVHPGYAIYDLKLNSGALPLAQTPYSISEAFKDLRQPRYNNTARMASLGQQVILTQPEMPHSCQLAIEKPVDDKPVEIKPAKDILKIFPEPMVVSPQLEHQQAFIILLGRGSTAHFNTSRLR